MIRSVSFLTLLVLQAPEGDAGQQFAMLTGQANVKPPRAMAQAWQDFIERFPAERDMVQQARINRAGALVAIGEYDDADREAKKVLAERPTDPLVRDLAALRLGQARLGRGRAKDDRTLLTKAHELFDDLARREPGSPVADQATFHRTEAIDALGRHAEAAERFLRLATEHAEDRLGLAARFQAGRSLVLAGQHEAGLDPLGAFLAGKPTRRQAADARLYRARALGRLGRSSEALAELEAASADLEATKAEEAACANVELQRGHLLRELKRAPEAIAAYDRAAGGPQAAEAGYFAGALRAEAGDHAGAIKSFEAALARGPAAALDEELRYRIAWSGLQARDYCATAAASAELLRRHPRGRYREKATFLRATACDHIRDWKGAAEAWSALAKLSPKDRAACLASEGEALLELKDTAGAAARFRAVLGEAPARSPEAARAHLGLGLIHAAAERLDEAASAFRSAEVAGRNTAAAAEASRQLGIVLACQDRLADAAEQFAGAAALHATHREVAADCWFQAGVCLERMNRDDEATNCFRQLVKLHRESRQAAEAHAQFPELCPDPRSSAAQPAQRTTNDTRKERPER